MFVQQLWQLGDVRRVSSSAATSEGMDESESGPEPTYRDVRHESVVEG
jgi:hypothetical protein